MSITPSELCNIKNCKTSKDVWVKLSEIYASKGPARNATLLKQLLFAKLSENGNMAEHLNKFFDIVDKLKSMAIEIADDLLSMIILYSIPSSYENFRCAIESRDELPKPDSLKIKLLEECAARKEIRNNLPNYNEDEAQAHYSKNQSIFNRKRKYENNYFDNSKKPKVNFKCNYCHKFGHKASDCWHKNDKRQDQSASQAQEKIEVWIAELTENENVINFSAFQTNNITATSWCVDSGATSHMCREEYNFTSFQDMSNMKVTLANNKAQSI